METEFKWHRSGPTEMFLWTRQKTSLFHESREFIEQLSNYEVFKEGPALSRLFLLVHTGAVVKLLHKNTEDLHDIPFKVQLYVIESRYYCKIATRYL